jgi:hypothetical protein
MRLKNRASIFSQSDARGAVSLVEATRANVHFAKEAHTFVAVSDTIKMIAKICIGDTSTLIGTGVASNVAIATSTHLNALFDSIVLLERRAAMEGKPFSVSFQAAQYSLCIIHLQAVCLLMQTQ